MRDRQEILSDARALYEYHAAAAAEPKGADLILALGSHDLRVPEYAAALFSRGAAPLVICSGGLGKITEGLWTAPEGELFAERCVLCGVPRERILIEREAKNTGENFSLSRRLCLAAGLRPTTGIAVCKPYMARRALAAGTKQWPELRWQVSVPPIPFEEYCGDGDALAREIELMTGDLQRLVVYAEKGFQSPVEVPQPVWEAYERLVRDGYDRYVIR